MQQLETFSRQRRFWIADHAEHIHWDRDGFLLDPDSVGEDEYALVAHFRTLEELRDVPCLILLGGPGLGKTVELRHEGIDRQGGSRSLFVDLGSTRSEDRIEHKIFNSTAYHAWLQGSHLLHLYLDSLDEAQANIGTIADLLADGLADAPVSRLRLRLACREAERNRRLEDFLASRFHGDSFATYRLLPLRLRDVWAIASGRDVNPDEFVSDVIKQRLQPLAMSPITLNLLLEIFAIRGALPHTRAEAYRQGCLILCGETAERRETSSLSPNLTPGQRLAVAARIAATMVFSGRIAIRTAPGLPGLDEVGIEEVAGSREIDTSTGIATPFDIGLREVHDTFKCALFKGVTGRGLVFSHRSYLEFLAAYWIASSSLSQEQVGDLLLEPGQSGKVWPQLVGLASWLATLTQEQFEWLLEHDAEAILDADLALAQPRHRERVVEAWIQARVDCPASSHPVDRAMRNLQWPEAIIGLRTVLFDRTADVRSRIISGELIAAAGFDDLDGALADVALDTTQAHAVRVAALRAMLDVGSQVARRRVRPLAMTNGHDDPDDLIQAVALYVTWPKVLSTTEALDAFHPPSSEYSTSFEYFFTRRLPQMDAADYAVGLGWALRVGDNNNEWPAAVLRDKLLCVASDGLGDPDVAEPYVELAAQLLRSHGRVISSSADCRYPLPFSSAESRRILLTSLVSRVKAGTLESAAITRDRDLINPQDRAWVTARAGEASDRISASTWNAIVAAIPPDRSRDCSSHRHVQSLAPAARTADAELEQALDRFEVGDLSAFGVTLAQLRVYDTGNLRGGHGAGVCSLPGWERQSEKIRLRIVSAAERYFANQQSNPNEWFDQGDMPQSEWDAYRAVRLVKECRPEALDHLEDALWSRWAAMTVAIDIDDGELSAWARSEVARVAPKEFSYWFSRRLDREIQEEDGTGTLSLRYHHKHWLPLVETIILDRARDASLSPAAREDLLMLLVSNGSVEGTRLAHELVSISQLSSKNGRKLAMCIARALALASDDAGWSRTWPLLLADESFAREFIADLGGGGMHLHITDKLSAPHKADLFLMLARYFPSVVSSNSSGGYVSTQVKAWGSALLSSLLSQDGTSGVEQLDRLVEAFPEYDLLRFCRHTAGLLKRRALWSPAAPRDIVRLAQDADRRWINSPGALQGAVIASLGRAQAELRGQPPAAEQLWSTRPSRPKDEAALSNWVALFLRRDLTSRGIVVGREVQVGAAPGGGRGDSVDLQIDAVGGVDRGQAAVHSVIVEVKGCWHRDLEGALERQLVDRYLTSVHRYGIYLVGWFSPSDWQDQLDERRQRSKGTSAADLRNSLAKIADEVSHRRGVTIEVCVLDCSLSVNTNVSAEAP
jgi:hypothetical protein